MTLALAFALVRPLPKAAIVAKADVTANKTPVQTWSMA